VKSACDADEGIDMRQAVLAGCIAVAACGAATAPELAVIPPESQVDKGQLAACGEV
jgi:hypothetical protein